MIFISRNEKSEPAWELVLDGRKTVTRRLNYVEVGKIRAVQPGRGKPAVGYIIIKNYILHKDWYERLDNFCKGITNYEEALAIFLQSEAKREGFKKWESIELWFANQKVDINKTYRIEFKLIIECCETCRLHNKSCFLKEKPRYDVPGCNCWRVPHGV